MNPILRVLLERRVHRAISRDNDRLMKSAIERGVAAMRAHATRDLGAEAQTSDQKSTRIPTPVPVE
jgi:hypothetical protein